MISESTFLLSWTKLRGENTTHKKREHVEKMSGGLKGRWARQENEGDETRGGKEEEQELIYSFKKKEEADKRW